jgi:hypothetical protein
MICTLISNEQTNKKSGVFVVFSRHARCMKQTLQTEKEEGRKSQEQELGQDPKRSVWAVLGNVCEKQEKFTHLKGNNARFTGKSRSFCKTSKKVLDLQKVR